jgi:hypothetical protein
VHKSIILLTILIFQFNFNALGKIIKKEDGVFIQSSGKEKEVFLVNQLLKKGLLSNLTTYKDGQIHLLSFKTINKPLRLYSVDSKGFIYDIKPFSEYEVSEVTPAQYFKFKELPKKSFRVDAHGFFVEATENSR